MPAIVGLAAALLAGVGVVMASHSPKPARTPTTAVVGLQAAATGTILRRYDALTLRRVGRRSLTLRFGLAAWSPSPDGRQLALGGSEADVVTLIDPRSLRPISSTSLHGSGYVADLAWLAPDRLAVLTSGPHCCGLDPTILSFVAEPGGRLLWQRHFAGGLVDAADADGTLVFLLVPRGRIGPARIYAWTAHGGGAATLRGVESGFARVSPSQHARTLSLTPGLALDRRGGRGYVVSATGAVATVDLAAMTVRTRQVGVERFVARRLPVAVPRRAAEEMVTPGEQRQALLVGPNTLAVWGDDAGVRRHGSGWRAWRRASGLCLVDTRSWRVSRLDRTSDDAILFKGLIVATGTRTASDTRLPGGSGVTGYDRRGRRRFHLLGGSAVYVLGGNPRTGLLYASARWPHADLVAVDVAQGRIVHDHISRRRLPQLLSSPDRPFAFM